MDNSMTHKVVEKRYRAWRQKILGEPSNKEAFHEGFCQGFRIAKKRIVELKQIDRKLGSYLARSS